MAKDERAAETSEFIYRVTLVMPVEELVTDGNNVALASWLNAQLGQNTVPDDLGPPLNASGSPDDPFTHHWCSSVWTEADCTPMMGHLSDLAGISRVPPPTWNGWTMEQKCGWTNDTLDPGLRTNANGGALMEDAKGESNPFALIEEMGLQTISYPAATE